jgi:hypothetical protein
VITAPVVDATFGLLLELQPAAKITSATPESALRVSVDIENMCVETFSELEKGRTVGKTPRAMLVVRSEKCVMRSTWRMVQTDVGIAPMN